MSTARDREACGFLMRRVSIWGRSSCLRSRPTVLGEVTIGKVSTLPPEHRCIEFEPVARASGCPSWASISQANCQRVRDMRVLITGAAGRIGTEMVDVLAQAHDIRLIDRVPVSAHHSIVADLADARVRNL